MAKDTEGYKGHRAGSNKGKVHMVFDEKGKEAAIKKAEALDLETSTARTWCSQWAKKKSSKPAPAKKTVKKAAAKTAKKAPAKKPAAKKAVKRETMESRPSA